LYPTPGGGNIRGDSLMKKCPYCAEEIQEDAKKCKHCGEMLSPGMAKPQARGLGSFLFSPKGRINRGQFWLGSLIVFVVLIVVSIGVSLVDTFLSTIIENDSGYLLLGFPLPVLVILLVGLIATWITLVISIKRWHDRDKSGWSVLIGLIPIIGGLWVWIECGFLPGTEGPNKYGDVPGPFIR
jgi:uncharacterized membrane protein YhaH (DUF805 family)